MYCKNCGKEVADGTKFCPDCGQPIENGNSTGQAMNQHLENAQNKLDDIEEKQNELQTAETEEEKGKMKKEIEVSGKKFNMLEIITFGSTILTVIACFLPFISMGYYSVSLMDAGKDAIIFIILAGATSVLAYVAQDLAALCAAIVTLVYLIVELSDINSALSGMANLGIGAYLMIVAVAGLIIGTLLVYINNKKHN